MNKQDYKEFGKRGADIRWRNKFAMHAELTRRLKLSDQESLNIKGISEKESMIIIKALRKVQGLKD